MNLMKFIEKKSILLIYWRYWERNIKKIRELFKLLLYNNETLFPIETKHIFSNWFPNISINCNDNYYIKSQHWEMKKTLKTLFSIKHDGDKDIRRIIN